MTLSEVRLPAVAGMFYPADPVVLSEQVKTFLHKVPARNPDLHVRAMILPHAGYSYSGQIAAYGYSMLAGLADIERVAVLCPAHRWPLRGIAAPVATSFATPLGEVAVDVHVIDSVVKSGLAIRLDEAHKDEHAIEVHLPFLQKVLPQAKLVPLVVGHCETEDVLHLLQRLLQEDTFVIVSSDLSHFLKEKRAGIRDAQTIRALLNLQENSLRTDDACGYYALAGLLACARQQPWQATLLAQGTSADTGGDRDRVVGYASLAYGSPLP